MEAPADYSFVWGYALAVGLVVLLYVKFSSKTQTQVAPSREDLQAIRARQQAQLTTPPSAQPTVPTPATVPTPPADPVPIRRVLPGQDRQPEKRTFRERFGTLNNTCGPKG